LFDIERHKFDRCSICPLSQVLRSIFSGYVFGGDRIAQSNMSKIKYVGIPIVLASAVCIWLFTKRITCRFPAVNKFMVASVQYGPFIEYIPVSGEFLRDTIPDIHVVRVQIDEMYINRIFIGLKTTTRLNDSVYVLELTHIYPDVIDGLVTVDMNFIERMPPRQEGESLRLRLEFSNSTDAVMLPRGDFYFDTGGKWVFVIEQDSAVRRDIKIGRKNFDSFEVIEGLKPGEQVIISSYQRFKDRQSVKLSLMTDTSE
jgi:hypothetical protein